MTFLSKTTVRTWFFGLAMLLVAHVHAQTIDLPLVIGGGTPMTIVQHVQLGTTVNLRIRPTGGTTPYDFSITAAPVRSTAGGNTTLGPGPDTYNDGSLTISAVDGNAATAGITVTGPAGTTEREYNFTITALDAGTPTRSRTATVKLVFRNPLKLVFAIDRSGSMECRPNEPAAVAGPTGWPDCVSSATPPKKWFMVRDALQQFSAKMTSSLNSTFFPGTDLFGVSYFDGIISTSSTFATPMVDVSTFASGILADFDAQFSSGALGRNGTNIGVGMTGSGAKIGTLSANHREVIVLITDGMQNNTFSGQVHSNGKQLNNGTSLNNNQASPPFYQVYSLGFDANTSPGSYGALLSNISTNPTQNYFYTDALSSYTPTFDLLFERIFNAYSPQIVHIGQKPITSDSIVETVTVNNGGALLMFNLGFENAQAGDFDYTLRKDGQDMTQYARQTIGRYSTLLTINFMEHLEIGTGGEWQIVCRSRVPVFPDIASVENKSRAARASVVCTIEEPILDAVYSLGKNKFSVGNTVRPSVKLSKNGVSVKNAIVTAELVKPGDDKGDLIARASVPATVQPGSEINNVFSTKYANVRTTDPSYLSSLAPVTKTITLTETGDGVYEGSFPDRLDVSDNFTVEFRTSFNDDALGQVRRVQRLNAFAGVGEIDINLGGRSMKPLTINEKKYFQLTLSPAYKVKDRVRLVGPGYGHAFLLGNKREAIETVIDHGDGSYTLTVERDKASTLYLQDDPIYSGPYAFFQMPYTKYKWNLSAHLGGTAPLNQLDTLYDNGAFFEIDFGRRILPFLSADLYAGYYGFKSDFNVLGAMAYLTGYILPNATWNIGLSAGAGFYFPKNLDAELGYGYRVFFDRNLSPRLAATAEIGRITGTKSDLDFLRYGIGLKYRF